MHTGIASRPQQERCPGQLRLRSSPCTSVGKHTDVNICGHAHKGTTEYICRHTHKRRMRAQTHSHKVWTWIDAARVCVTSAYFWSGLFELPSQPGTHRQTHTQMPTHVRARACTPASQPAQKRRWRRFACAHQRTEKNNRRRWRGLALPCHYDHFGLRGADLYGSEVSTGGTEGGGPSWVPPKKSPANSS